MADNLPITTKADQGYPLLGTFAEPQRSLLRVILDRLNSVQGRINDTIAWKADVSANGFSLTDLGDPVNNQDAATRYYVDTLTDPQRIANELSLAGDASLNVTNLYGVLAQPQRMGIQVIPDTETLPPVAQAQAYEVVTWQGKLYYFDPTASNPGTWVVLTAATSILANTHAIRLSTYLAIHQPLGLLYWETDRTAMYRVAIVATVKTWVLMFTRPYRNTAANRPADLTVSDAGYLFQTSDKGDVIQYWTGSAWKYASGILRDTFANRPAANTCLDGFFFLASDYGGAVWRSDATNWILMPGWGGPMRGTRISADQRPATFGANDVGFLFDATDAGLQRYRWSGSAWVLQRGYGGPLTGNLSAIPGGLDATDTDFLYYASDFDREYVWVGGATWADGPGAPTRYQITMFNTPPEGNGWHVCDGTIGVTRSTNTGGTTTYNVPDWQTNNPFIRGTTGGSGGTFAATGSFYNYVEGIAYVRL